MTSLSDLTLVRCTEEQKIECRRHAWAQWGYSGTFTHDEWVGRDEQFDKTEWAKSDGGNGFVTWALVPRSDPTTLDMLSHCETYRRPSIMSPKNSNEVKEVVSYGIATVITPPIHRGHAYGRYMLQLLHYVIAPIDKLPPFPEAWGSPPQFTLNDAAFSVLYSGVGTKFYASCTRGDGETKLDGWVWAPTTLHTYKVEPTESVNQDGWKWLSVQDVADLEPRIAQDMKKALEGTKGNSYAILPTNTTLSTHAFRNTLSPSGKTGRSHGLVLPLPDNPFITYTYPVGGPKMVLQVTYVHPGFPFSAVLAAAKRENCGSISIWGPSSRGNKQATKDGIETRQRWDNEAELNGHEVGKDHKSETACWVVYGDQEDNDWCYREAYTWC